MRRFRLRRFKSSSIPPTESIAMATASTVTNSAAREPQTEAHVHHRGTRTDRVVVHDADGAMDLDTLIEMEWARLGSPVPPQESQESATISHKDSTRTRMKPQMYIDTQLSHGRQQQQQLQQLSAHHLHDLNIPPSDLQQLIQQQLDILDEMTRRISPTSSDMPSHYTDRRRCDSGGTGSTSISQQHDLYGQDLRQQEYYEHQQRQWHPSAASASTLSSRSSFVPYEEQRLHSDRDQQRADPGVFGGGGYADRGLFGKNNQKTQPKDSAKMLKKLEKFGFV